MPIMAAVVQAAEVAAVVQAAEAAAAARVATVSDRQNRGLFAKYRTTVTAKPDVAVRALNHEKAIIKRRVVGLGADLGSWRLRERQYVSTD
ncbi:MAG: hypothetical protein KDJ31_18710 [Candidatus Competibacteraceae bacterium]|nr:hypothetical protein [Candidatus Competibacteraceae bacterium]MCB1820000.1 hypothetical protein [Candidatus Competibacteraceae bacterium]